MFTSVPADPAPWLSDLVHISGNTNNADRQLNALWGPAMDSCE